MSVAAPVPVSASVLVWARTESGYALERAAEKLAVKPERLAEWESGDRQPTMRQIETLAKVYHRPLSLFFQPKPPALPPLAAEYRRLPGITPGEESPELRLAIRKMSGRRETMLQLLVELGESTPVFDLVAHLSESPATVAERLRAALAINPTTQRDWASEWQAWAARRGAVERIGVLVFQFAKVPLAEARGLALLRTPLPVAAVNPKEIPEARAFTLVHEVVHLMLAAGKEEVPAAREVRDNEAWAAVERFAEEAASHTLVSEAMLAQEIRRGGFPRNGWDIGDVRSLARRFRITPLALATRLRASGYFDWNHYQSWRRGWESYVSTLKPKAGGFAHPIDLALGRAGRPFTRTVLEALEATKSGAGQYFTPRALIKAMVECVAPEPGKSIADPACGTGGFFLSAYDYLVGHHQLNRDQKAFLKNETFRGNEIVPGTRRLCLMNLFLHNIGEIDGNSLISSTDALIASPSVTVDYVLANPPFGKKSSMTFTNEEGEQEKEDLVYNRQDFWATTSNKQLNFLQHIRTLLKTTGRAAVVLPDNVLFEGGAGETVRKKLMETTELHTILRLPTGIFYANGVKANVLFFENRPASKTVATKEVWYYDYRTNIHHTLKRKPLRLEDLREFIDCYHPTNRHKRTETWHAEKNPEGRWRKFTHAELIARDKTSLDLFWLKDDSLADLDNLPEPDVLADEIIENIEAGLANFRTVAAALGK